MPLSQSTRMFSIIISDLKNMFSLKLVFRAMHRPSCRPSSSNPTTSSGKITSPNRLSGSSSELWPDYPSSTLRLSWPCPSIAFRSFIRSSKSRQTNTWDHWQRQFSRPSEVILKWKIRYF